MALSVEQIREAIKSPQKRQIINKAVAYQRRIKFHVNTQLSRETSAPERDFLCWVKSLIPEDKYEVFKSLYRHPVKTTEVTGVIFDMLSRVFMGRNAVSNIQFMSTEEKDYNEWYMQERLDWANVWSSLGWENFKTEINSILVVDLPTEQTSKIPEPYFYWLNIGSVVDYRTVATPDGASSLMEWIIFLTKDDTYAVYDNERYRIFEKQSNGDIGAELINNPHDLGYCPARFFWDTSLDLDEPDIKWHPLAKVFSDLDWYLFFALSKRYLDMFGSYPIYSGYEQSCDYNNEQGDECHAGFIKGSDGMYRTTMDGTPVKCPKCGHKRIVGAGSFLEIPVPIEGVQPDLRNPIQMLSADAGSLAYNVDEVTRLREMIITSVAGQSDDLLGTEAVNETQIDATFESQTTILNRVKMGFESAENFVAETVARLQHGERFVSVNINLGTEFYLSTAASLRKQYADAKNNGASESELDALHMQIIETEYKNDPIQLQRMIILFDLEPYHHMGRNEVIGLNAAQLIDFDDLQIKLNFVTFVRRFERENTNVIEFGSEIPYERKIEIITNTLKSYVSINRPEPPAPPTNE